MGLVDTTTTYQSLCATQEVSGKEFVVLVDVGIDGKLCIFDVESLAKIIFNILTAKGPLPSADKRLIVPIAVDDVSAWKTWREKAVTSMEMVPGIMLYLVNILSLYYNLATWDYFPNITTRTIVQQATQKVDAPPCAVMLPIVCTCSGLFDVADVNQLASKLFNLQRKIVPLRQFSLSDIYVFITVIASAPYSFLPDEQLIARLSSNIHVTTTMSRFIACTSAPETVQTLYSPETRQQLTNNLTLQTCLIKGSH